MSAHALADRESLSPGDGAGGASVFEIAGGSVAGHAHVSSGRNNQDASCWAQNGAGLVAVVCDGCGSAAHSDVGAEVGARMIVRSAARLLAERLDPRELLERVRLEVVADLRMLATAMSCEELADRAGARSPRGVSARYSQTVTEHFLFTVVGVLVANDTATTFSFGDGLVVVNGERRVLGPYANNEPPYLGYDLLTREEVPSAPRMFEVHASQDLAGVRSVLLGTDGALDLDEPTSQESDAPSTSALTQFWEDDRFFRNADMTRRRLVLMSRGVPGRKGRLPDDTTLVVVRRRKDVAHVRDLGGDP